MSRISGWVLPDGSYFECLPWEHIAFAKTIPWLVAEMERFPRLKTLWQEPDEEKMRSTLASLGMVKVCYHLIDADLLNKRQLATLQSLYDLFPLEDEIEFIGRIKAKLPLRIFLKMRDPERLNQLW